MEQETRKTIINYKIPRASIAALAEIAASEVSEFMNQHSVSDRSRVKIQGAVVDIQDLLEFFRTHFDLRPDLKDIEGLRLAIQSLKDAKRSVELQKEARSAESGN